MPVFETPKSLVDLSINSMCDIVFTLLSKGVSMSEKTDNDAGVKYKMDKVFTKGKSKKSPKCSPSIVNSAKRSALDLLGVKQLIGAHGEFSLNFTKYIKDLPSEFVNEILARVLNNLFRISGYVENESETYSDDEEHSEGDELLESDVHQFMRDNWSFPPRIRVAFRLIMKCLLSRKIHTLNMNALTNKYFKIFTEFVRVTAVFQEDEYINAMRKKNRTVFISPLIGAQDEFSSLTSISMQHLADGALLWCICCNCPNLWYLDLSGKMFDLQRYAVNQAAEYYVAAVANDVSGVLRTWYKEADFIDSLCGLYGNSGKPHPLHDGIAQGCFKLRKLLLPSYGWEDSEEKTLFDEMVKIFQQLPYLEEVTGVSLLRILCSLNESEDRSPLMLKLKKFDGKTGGNRLIGVYPGRLAKVKLPLVEEGVFTANAHMTPNILIQLFPNLQHLTINPYEPQSYNFYSIIRFLQNLVSLDIEFNHGLSLANMYDIAKHCCLLKALSVTCPALLNETTAANDTKTSTGEKKKKLVQLVPLPYRVDQQEKKVYEPVEYEDNKYNVFYYRRKLQNVWMTGAYPLDDRTMPVFSKLQKLQFFNLRQVDNYALFQCVRGSPLLQIFTVVVSKLEPDCKERFDDYFVGKLAPYLRRAREVTFAVNKDKNGYMRLSGAAVAHFLYFCPDIRSINRLGDWNMSEVETEGLNYYFKTKNYVVRVH